MNSASPALVDIDEAAEDLCPTCKHPLVSHDVISARWCAATKLGIGRRKCICSGVLATHASSPTIDPTSSAEGAVKFR